MPDFTSTLPDTHFLVPQRSLKALLEAYRQELFTGLLRLRYPSGVDLVSTYLDGVQNRLYRCHPEKMEVIPRQSWSFSMDRPDASIASLKLSVEALRLMKVAHEAPVVHNERMGCTPKELSVQVAAWAEENQPSILRLQEDSCEKIYLIAGNSTPVIEELTFSGNEGQFSLQDSAFTNALSKLGYPITRYISDSSHDVWQEYELRFAFESLMRFLVIRFIELAGRVLAERLCEKVSLQLQDRGWRIHMTMNGLVNHQYFDSFEEVKTIYTEIQRCFQEESSQAIGSHLVDRLVHETFLKLGARRSELLDRHVYGRDMQHRSTGKAWR